MFMINIKRGEGQMNTKNYAIFILILFSILVIPIGNAVTLESGIVQEGGEDSSKPQVVYSQERYLDPEHQELVELLKYYRKIGDRENALKILEKLSPPIRENQYQSGKISTLSFAVGGKEESEISSDSRWETIDIPVMATDSHEKNPSIETRDFGSQTPDLYIAAEFWEDTTSADMIRIRRSWSFGSGPTWWDTGDTLSLNSTYPLLTPKIKQATEDYMGVVFVEELSASDHDIIYASVNATDFSDVTFYNIDISADDHIQPAFTSDYIEYPNDTYLYVVYYKVNPDTAKLLFRRSTDDGATWSAPTILAEFNVGYTTHCSIDYCDDELYVAYTYLSGDSDEIAVVKSSNYGNTWSLPTIVAAGEAWNSMRYPEITACTADTVFVVFESTWLSTDIKYSYTTDGGSSAPLKMESWKFLLPIINHRLSWLSDRQITPARKVGRAS